MTLETQDVEKLTPMMEQWKRCKQDAKEALLFFRMGDFYEAFFEDARIIAEELELTLTKRQGLPMSGVPWHTIEGYIDRLVNKGYRVAVAEQVEDPKQAKGLVAREIVRIVTPGTLVSSSLEGKKHNFIACLTRVGAIFGIASLDVTTGDFRVIEEEDEREALNELARIRPSEIVVSKKFYDKQESLFKEIKALISFQEEWYFDHKTSYAYLTDHFKMYHLDGFGLKGMVAAINAAGALLAYLRENLSLSISHIREIRPDLSSEFLALDRTCQRNLELSESLQEGGRKHTLLELIDQTSTPMGGRLIGEWIKKPLLSVKGIIRRQEAVEVLYFAGEARMDLRKRLTEIRDLERLMSKVTSGLASPKDLAAIRDSLEKVIPIKACVSRIGSELLHEACQKLVDLTDLITLLKEALVDEPSARLSEGNVFREGFHAPLDEFFALSRGGKEWLMNYQAQIREATGIKTLKVHFNKIFGYYIEVSKGQAHFMPDTFQRRQTLVNAERFISPELKEYEQKVLSAEERIQALELVLFQSLKEKTAEYAEEVFGIARALAQIDTLQGLAESAKRLGFCRPIVDESDYLEIIGGRHPVVEASCGKERFIPNDTHLDGAQERMMLITGPNMAGKSTYIRQVALIVILAQMGSFVPADSARIGLVDKIFTRIGASDDLSRGQSTFMVEMSETANILNNATTKSLVILDEIGRGTSTFDGVAIAWSVAEYLLTTHGKQAKTLFATHYWELTQLEEATAGAVNYHASVQDWNDTIVFLHKIVKGGADKSYGIHVARLAGIPHPVIVRAQTILKRLEAKKETQRKAKKETKETQLTLFNV